MKEQSPEYKPPKKIQKTRSTLAVGEGQPEDIELGPMRDLPTHDYSGDPEDEQITDSLG